MPPGTFADLEKTNKMLKLKKVTLGYLSETAQPDTLIRLSELFKKADPQDSGFVTKQVFFECCKKSNLQITERTMELVCEAVREEFKAASEKIAVPANVAAKQKDENLVFHKLFLDTLYVAHLYFQELDLYHAFLAADVDGNNGVTITQAQAILRNNPKLKFPEEALGAAFKTLLGADIHTIDPNCIIDTQKFIASLHREFEGISTRSLSQKK